MYRLGTMTLELGDASTIRCASTGLVCEMDFQTKGFFSGQVNSVVAKIKRESTQEILYDITGQWSGELFIKKHDPSEEKPSTVGSLLVNCTQWQFDCIDIDVIVP